MRFLKILLSTKITLVLLLIFAVSMAAATFIENDHGTLTARAMVYEAWWFELVMVWMAVNFLAHIRQYRLFSKGKWPVGLFHAAFVVIILGAGVTRYFATEGMIHIRENSEENTFYTSERYVQVKVLKEAGGEVFEKKVSMTPQTFESFKTDVSLGGKDLRVKFANFIPAGKEDFKKGDETFLAIAVTTGDDREDYLLKEGKFIEAKNLKIGTGSNTATDVQIFKTDSGWSIRTNTHLQMMEMATQQMGILHAGEQKPLKQRTLYQWDGGAFVVKSIHENAALTYISETDEKLAEGMPDVAHLIIENASGEKLTDAFIHTTNIAPAWKNFEVDGEKFAVTYGPKAMTLPFGLFLKDFQLERYPGSESPSSYASIVEVRDGVTKFPFKIFMNNVLDHAGYRFYQASYDTDEMGTVLSINQDRPGTIITYIGYTLLTLGMVFTLFARKSRFGLLNRKLDKMHEPEKEKVLKPQIPVALSMFFALAMNLSAQSLSDIQPTIVPKEKADAYGRLIVQDMDGRMKPLNTLAHEIVRKLSGKSTMQVPLKSGDIRLTPEQFLLAVQLHPEMWSELPIIKIDKEKSLEVFKKLGMKQAERLSFKNFVTDDGKYLLQDLVEKANKLKPSERNESHKEILKTDERFNIFYGLLSGDFLRLFPMPGDANNTWITKNDFTKVRDEEITPFIKNIVPLYLQGVRKGVMTGDWAEADESLEYINLYQKKVGASVYPTETDIKAEILYTKLNLSNRLFGPFWLLGIVMLVFSILFLFFKKRWLEIGWGAGVVLSWFGLLVFTFHLGLRWFVAKHAPWSDGFEMLVFVAWGVLLFGLLFSGKSRFTLPLGLLFSGTLLFVSFLDWLNPDITNLMPVLHSYWLKIHVAIIVSGYAPLALAAIIALLGLLLIIFKPKNPNAQWLKSMKELSIVGEMSITIGLFLLTVGTFLGGVWANESWGRYWAWDPKETWALISIIVYSIVLHLRLIPRVRTNLVFNLAALWAFSSIIMTSFGVNYYLAGLHSYAKGDPVPVPLWVYWCIGILLVISIAAIIRYRQLDKRAAGIITI
jgi:cytochrome c-type biogenesis protein CcsB